MQDILHGTLKGVETHKLRDLISGNVKGSERNGTLLWQHQEPQLQGGKSPNIPDSPKPTPCKSHLIELEGTSDRQDGGLVTKQALGKSHGDYQCLGASRRKSRVLAGFCWSSPGVPALPSAFQSLPHMPRPAKTFAFAMTSHSAKSKHALHFFHGQILTPNCQCWPLCNPNGKPPFPPPKKKNKIK